MTTTYTVEIRATKTHLKLTYSNNKFKKMEHVKGSLDDGILKKIGLVIPGLESHLNTFKTQFKDRVVYNKVVKEKSTYSKFLSEWYSFYNNYTELPPKFTGADGNALKAIIKYLTELHAGNETEALDLWKVILSKWDTLSNFHQSNTDLKYISSKLNIILNAIKKQNNTFASRSSGSVQL